MDLSSRLALAEPNAELTKVMCLPKRDGTRS